MRKELPLLSKVDLLEWKLLDSSSLSELYNLVSAVEQADDVTYKTSLLEIENFLKNPHKQYVGAYNNENKMIAYGLLTLKADEKTVYCTGGVHPDWRCAKMAEMLIKSYKKIGIIVLQKYFRSKKIFNIFPKIYRKNREYGYVVLDLNDSKSLLKEVIGKINFKSKNRFFEMRKKIDAPVAFDEKLPPFTHILPWNACLDELVKKANNEISNELGYEILDAKQWHKYLKILNKNLCPVLVDKTTDRTKVIGYIISSKYEQDWVTLKHKETYIDLITILPKFNQKILVKALLEAHMNIAFKEKMQYVAIGIDPDNQPELYEILKELGFELSHSSTEYVSNPILL